ncbi:efflux RND transporter periplasmic adaptor subunit [Patescibacteria group bacterium]|nr:efflux RND transporter periplasmic adaptor subunit [Patescibacteria group bacterium]MBU4512946.1 efflux RND transporter periplasmic adaptor subunit [Patescibacteria group bacterium]
MKKAIFIILGIIVIIGVSLGGYRYFKRGEKINFDYIITERGELVQEVNITGRIKPAESVDLAFENTGKIANIYVQIGDKVTTSQILIEIDNTDANAQLAQAQAGVDSSQAELIQYQATLEAQQTKLLELIKGTRPEEIQLSETKVINAQKALADAQENLKNTLNKAETELAKAQQTKTDAEINLANITSKSGSDLADLYSKAGDILDDAYAKADDAVKNRTSGIFTAGSNKLSFATTNSQAKSDAESQKPVVENALNELNALVYNLTSDYIDLDEALARVKDYLIIIKDFFSRLDTALSSAADLSQTTLTTYQTNTYTARTNVNTVLSNINVQQNAITTQNQTNQTNIDTAQSQLNTTKAALSLQEAANQSNVSTAQAGITTAQNTLASAQDELSLKKAGSTAEQIAVQRAIIKQAQANTSAQRARIKQAEANLQNYQAQKEKTTIRAPMDGIVTKQDAKVGEIVSASANIISLISEKQFEIEALIPEADTAKVKVNDLAKVTLDAYTNNIIFKAKVIRINPAETMIEGMATYKTILQFADDDERIKSGMTANVDILTNKRENVIAIPGRAVISRNGGKMVQIVRDDDTITEVEVKTGIRGSDGRIEILSGVSEGYKVITFMEEE